MIPQVAHLTTHKIAVQWLCKGTWQIYISLETGCETSVYVFVGMFFQFCNSLCIQSCAFATIMSVHLVMRSFIWLQSVVSATLA